MGAGVARIEDVLAARRRGLPAAAESACRELIADNPQNVEALNLLGALALEAGRAKDAQDVLRRSLAIQEDQPDTLFNLGLALGAGGDPHEASHVLARAILKRPGFADGYYNLGLALQSCGNDDKARLVYERAILLDARHARALNNLALLHHRANRLADAVTHYRRALAADPELPTVRANLGSALLSLGQRGEAEAVFAEALVHDPRDPTANYVLARLALNRGAVEDSIAKLTTALYALRDSDGWLQHGSPMVRRLPVRDVEAYREALRITVEVLEAAGIEACLLCGTLLGAVRDGKILSFDKDIDLGIDSSVTPERLDAVLSAAGGYVPTKPVRADDVIPAYFYNGVPIDFFRLFREGATVWYGLEWYGHPVRWRHADFTLKDFEFLGVRTKIPVHPERYLTEAYGNWHKPDPYFGTWSSPNMDDGFPLVARCMAFENIFRAAWVGDRDWAAAACKQFLGLDPSEMLVADLRDKIAAAPPLASTAQAAVLPSFDDPLDDLA